MGKNSSLDREQGCPEFCVIGMLLAIAIAAVIELRTRAGGFRISYELVSKTIPIRQPKKRRAHTVIAATMARRNDGVFTH